MKSSPPPSPSPALSPPSDHKPDKEELIKGRDLAIALRAVLRNQQKGSWLESAGTHVENLVKLFTQAISARDSDESPESGQNPASILVCSSTSDDQSVEYSGKRGKVPVSKERREAYKRRRITSEIWTQVTATPLDDGLGWRKYGQKPILGAKHPRSYFRCTHKNDQNCGATKQVQKMEEDCSMYLVTYMGKHTCKDSNQAPPIILDYTPTEKCLLNFQSAPIRREDEVLPIPYLSSTLTSVKHEVDERNKLGHLDHKGSPASSSYSTAFSDQRAFESSTVPSMEFSAMEYMVSGLCSVTSSPIMDMVDSVGIEDMFNFYDEEFLGPFDQQQG